MPDILKHISSLSPVQRELLELLLAEEGVDLSRTMILSQRRDTDTFPLSFAQQRLWFLDQFVPGSPLYSIPSAVRLTGQLDVAALKKSLNEVVRRHEVLRTTFATQDGQAVQVIAPELALALPVIDLRDLPEAEREAEALRLATEEARRPFDLACGPLLRTTLLQLGEKEHIALLTMHHIVSDGWSMGVLIGEMATLYAAFSAGKLSPLPDLPIQYVDFACWQREWLRGQVLEEQIEYWKQQLSGSPPVLNLPTDRPRPAVQAGRGASLPFTLPMHLTEALKVLARQEGGTLFMVLLAAFQALLYHYTGQEDISVGSPIANRNRAEIEELIGFFTNTLVLRADLSGDPSFRELLGRVHKMTLDSYARQDLPFEMLVDELHPVRDMSYTPLFQVMFALQNASMQTQELPGLTISPLQVHSETAKFDLMLAMAEGTDQLSGAWEYNTDLFDAATIERIRGHFQTLMEGIVANPDQHISRLPLLTRAECHQLVVEWNDTRTDCPQDACIQHLFEAQVKRSPDSVAVVCGGRRLTCAELDRQANQLAHYLQKIGVGPEVLVGLCVERSVEMVVGILAILKAGGAYVPLDPAYPKERLAFILEDTQAPVLLTQARLVASLPTEGLEVVCLDRDWESISRECDASPESAVGPQNLAYVIYTSGSTGRPKGVMIQHNSALHLATALHHIIYTSHPSSHLRLSLNAPLSFDASVQQLVMLLYGHTLYVIPHEVRLDGEALLTYLQHNRLDVLDCVPSQLKLLLAAGLLDGAEWRPPVVLPGGEAIDESTWQVLASAAGIEFYNMYGPTECTVDSTIGRVKAAPGRPTIGRPVTNTRLYILNASLQPVPIGVSGELYIGGAGVGRGYLNRPALTAEKFIPGPFGDEPGARLYKTGDLARYLPDGNVEFLGRIDHQVKIHGFRIELEEIEAVLREHPAVREAVALARQDTPGDVRLVAYVVPAQDTAPSTGDLRKFLRGKLPEYMVPGAFVMLDALPLTPNGKVDLRALPAPGQARPDLEAPYVPPRTPAEEVLAALWANVLGLERPGIHDNFFELGGHSLLATQLISRLRDAFQVELPLRSLFETPTISGLTESIEAARRASSGLTALPIQPVPRKGDLPLSFAQQRLWFLDQLEPGSPLYNIPNAIRVSGLLDVTALEQSLNEIVRRHESLRTSFPIIDGRAVQVIAPELPVPLPLIDLRHLPAGEREAQARRLTTGEAQRPFDLAKGPLLRVTLLRLDEGEHVILLTMHHIVSDGWSTGVLVQELATLYQAFTVGQPSPLPELPIQYADFAHWQRQWLQGGHGRETAPSVLEAQLAYWKQQLDGSTPMLELPTDRPRPAVQSFRGAYRTFTLSETLSKALQDLSRQEGATLFMTLLAAFQVLLYRHTGQEDISVGTPIANRNRSEIEGLIGFFVNTLVLRADLSGQPGFREVLRQVRAAALGAYTHQDLPFEMLVDALRPERDMSHSPLFQVMFVLQNGPTESLALSGLTLTPLEVDSGMAKFDLTLSMVDRDGRLEGALEYSADLFDAATIRRMVEHFQTLLEAIVADPDRPISTLPLLAEAERHQLLVEWNDTAAEYPRARCAHQLFEAQVERTPEAIAVSFESETLTYRELSRRANQLAHYLQKLGVGPEVLVGMCVERSLEMIVGLLGVLKAGGAYLPLDPAYPPERLSFMLEDAQVPVLLTQARLVERMPALEVGARLARARRVICLDTDWGSIARESAENPASDVQPENLAYVIYTSGSTGKPKGVLVEHRGLCNLATAYIRDLDLGPGSRVLQFFSLSFDGSVADIFMALLSGAILCLVQRQALLPGPGLSEFLREQAITTAVMTPSVLALLPAEGLPALQTLLTGGEPCPPEVAARWAMPEEQPQGGQPQGLPLHRCFFNVYGPTEATVVASSFRVDSLAAGATNVPIGRPLANVCLYVLDRHFQPVPIGVPGELYIGGDGVARGYLNRPALTAERFFLNPFTGKPGARLYKTGDLVHYRPDGNIEFLGRVDDQVKVRGFRVELGEIEAVLGQHPGLRESAVAVREDETGNKRLVGYIVPAQGPGPGVGELRRFLGEKLPEYMIPSAFVTLEALPLTPSGKVDRRALPALDQTRPDVEATYVAPRSHKEKILAEIWAQMLGLEQVGIYDNFFELGGDSILSIQVIARANQAGLQLTPRQLFEAPTVAGLATVAGGGQAIQAEQGIVAGPLPLTPIQRWFFEQDLSEPHHWNQAVMLEVRQALDQTLLRASVGHLVEHHDVLRLRFKREDSGWEQTNAGSDGDVPFVYVDLSGLPEKEQRSEIESRAASLQASLDLSAGPLVRVAYFDLGAGHPGRLLIVVHHLAMDGVSWRILLEDLQIAYGQLSQGQAVQLPPKTTSFQYWAQRLAEYAQSEAVRAEAPYWLGLSQNGLARLPLDYPGEANTEASARSTSVSLTVEETQALLQEVPAAYHTEINDVLLTALAQVLTRWTGTRPLLVELEGHGRENLFEDADVSRTVGWFTTAYPVALELKDANGPGGALKAVKEQLRQVPHRGLGYGLLRYLSQDEEIAKRLQALPQAEVSFNYMGQFDQALPEALLFGLARESRGADRSLHGRRSHLLEINGGIAGGRLQLEWTYSENHHQRLTIERLAQSYVEALRAIIAHCQSPEAGGYTPSDFALARLDQKGLDKVLGKLSQAKGKAPR